MSESSWSDINGSNIEDFGILDAYGEHVSDAISEYSNRESRAQSRIYTSINPSIHQSYRMNGQLQHPINISQTPYPNIMQPSSSNNNGNHIVLPHSTSTMIDPLSDITQSIVQSLELSREIKEEDDIEIKKELEDEIKKDIDISIKKEEMEEEEVVIIKESDTVNSKILESRKKMNVEKFRNVLSSEMLEGAIMSVWTPNKAEIYRRGEIGNLDIEQLLFIVSDVRNKLLAALSVNEANQLFKCGASDLLCWIHENSRITKYLKSTGLNVREFCRHILDMALEDNVNIISASLRVIRNFFENNKYAEVN